MSRSDLLVIEDLRIGFAQYERGLQRRVLTVINGMSLHVGEGELVAVVGASGAGKTLLAHATLGMLPPNARQSGRVVFDGVELNPAARRATAGKDITLLPQSVTFLDPLARIGRQVRRAAKLAGIADPKQAMADSFVRVDLPADTAGRYPHELSGGMVRRVLWVIATLGAPRLVFADEPTPGLHPEVVEAALGGLRTMADNGTAVVLITHDLIGALGVADRVVVCHEGRTIGELPPAAFRGDGAELNHPYTRALWRALPVNGFHSPSTEDWAAIEAAITTPGQGSG